MNNLYAHNKVAYEKIMKHFSAGNVRAAVVHATGTGKSYIAAAVAEHFHHVLVIAPMEVVLNETRRAMTHLDYITFCTYAYVMLNYKQMAINYDLIILDEYHRSGARQWGAAVKHLVESNKDCKVLGLSATNIRYLDHERNMAEEMLDGNVVSQLTLSEAMKQQILPMPTLVECIYSFDETEKELRKKIEKCNRDEHWKQDQLAIADRAKLTWSKSHGPVSIIKKYVKQDMRRIILFAKNIKVAENLQSIVNGWFIKAGFRNVKFYQINCKSKTLQTDLDAFRVDDYDGTKIAIAINMFNEGVHIDGVDCLIMLRNTMSRIIVEQQLGRCLTAKNIDECPLILDFVDNLKIVYRHKQKHGEDKEKDDDIATEDAEKDTEKEGMTPLPFTIIDETENIRDIIDGIVFTSRSYDECKEIVSHFKSLSDLCKHAPAIYHYIKRKGWNDLLPQKQRNFHTYEECFNEALKYNTRADFQKESVAIYKYSREHGYLDKICTHMEAQCKHRTFEECMEEAKKYDNFYQLRNSSSAIASYIIRRPEWYKQVSDYYNSLPKTEKYSKEYLHKLALGFNKRIDFSNAYNTLYCFAKRKGWLNDICSHMEEQRQSHTKEECIDIARNYSTLAELRNDNNAMAVYIRKHGWEKDAYAHMKNYRQFLSNEELIAIGSSYNSLDEFRKKCFLRYNSAKKHDLLDIIEENIKNKKNNDK